MRMNLAQGLATVSALTLAWSCGDTPQQSEDNQQHASLEARWDWQNDPRNMDDNYWGPDRYRTRFEELPTRGQLSTKPWSGDYWPTYLGGITYRWNDTSSSKLQRYGYTLQPFSHLRSMDEKAIAKLSPAEKLDIYLGFDDYYITKYERSRTKILQTVKDSSEYKPGYKIPTWEGLCHSWAPATLLFQEPKPITLTGPSGHRISFGSSDIKALLVYYLHFVDSQTQFLGTRCNFDLETIEKDYRAGKITKAEYQKRRRSCDDTNAGAFHLVLTNQVGRLDEGFIADVTRDTEVWNQAIYAYKSRILRTRNSASTGAAQGTVKEVDVNTRMYYTTEIDHSFKKPTSQPRVHKNYDYTLELDGKGRIIGGAWQSDRADRPDFLWKQVLPKQSQNTIWRHVLDIYRKSVGQQRD